MKLNKLIPAFIAISAVTTYTYQFDIEPLKNVDTINHLLGGVLFAALIPKEVRKKHPLRFFFAATFVFVGWEFLEIFFTNIEFYPKLFEETASNRIQDVALDFLGFVVFYKR